VFLVQLYINGSSNWFGQQFDFLTLLFLVFLTLITIFFEDQFTPQSIGLMLTYAISLQNNLTWAFQSATTIENGMVAMERCSKYTIIEEEKPFEKDIDTELKHQGWPSNGKIEILNYSVRYRPTTEVVLKNINVQIKAGEKVGVVGRTGSGKSTICLCLFRLLEPLTGTIKIDDIDITEIGLNLLRQSLTIIPQDPSLMKGTLKYNIDPFDRYSTDDITEVLKMIRFSYILNENNEGLDKMVGESGDNLSVGEKQLICIVRAILRVSYYILY
jgi:ATP-binding cassette subfamily C (CFTR/MRP) protein 3